MRWSALIIFAAILGIAIFVFAFSSRSYFTTDNPILERIRHNYARINPAFAKIPLREGNSSYTENKEVITLCLRNPDTGKLYDMNTLMYVSAHELAHVITKSQGHTEEFKNKFAAILKRAAQLGFYDPKKPIPPTYCGVSSH